MRFPQQNRVESSRHIFSHLLGTGKFRGGAKTRVGIGYNGDGGCDDGKEKESVGNHVCMYCLLCSIAFSGKMRRVRMGRVGVA